MHTRKAFFLSNSSAKFTLRKPLCVREKWMSLFRGGIPASGWCSGWRDGMRELHPMQVGSLGSKAGSLRHVSAVLLSNALCPRQVALTAREMKLTRRNATSKIHPARLAASGAKLSRSGNFYVRVYLRKHIPSSLFFSFALSTTRASPPERDHVLVSSVAFGRLWFRDDELLS